MPVALSSSYSTAHVKGETINHRPSFNSDSLYTDSRGQSIGTGDGIFHTLEPSPAQQPVWSGTSAGHLSMADIVRLGRPSSKHSHISSETTSYTRQDAVTTNLDHYYEKSSQAPTTTQVELHRDILHNFINSNTMAELNSNSVSISFYEVQPDRVCDLLDSKQSTVFVLEDKQGKIQLKGKKTIASMTS